MCGRHKFGNGPHLLPKLCPPTTKKHYAKLTFFQSKVSVFVYLEF